MRFSKGIGMILTTFLSVILLTGCGPDKDLVGQYNSWINAVDGNIKQTDYNMKEIKDSLGNGSMVNAVITKSYADTLEAQFKAKGLPGQAELAKKLGKEATPAGNLYVNLEKDFAKHKESYAAIKKTVEMQKHDEGSYSKGIRELSALNGRLVNFGNSARPMVFNNSLGDVTNALASLSNGTLSRVMVDYKDTDRIAAGAFLVGNAAFGHWITRNGQQIWEWDDNTYRRFEDDDNWDMNIIYFGNWSNHRPYSYHVDTKVKKYGTDAQKKSYDKVIKTPSSLAEKGKKASMYGSKVGQTSPQLAKDVKNSQKVGDNAAMAPPKKGNMYGAKSSISTSKAASSTAQSASAKKGNMYGTKQATFKPKPSSSGWGFRSSSSSRSSRSGGK